VFMKLHQMLAARRRRRTFLNTGRPAAQSEHERADKVEHQKRARRIRLELCQGVQGFFISRKLNQYERAPLKRPRRESHFARYVNAATTRASVPTDSVGSMTDHRLCAARDLFRGLEQRDEGSAPRPTSFSQQFRRAQQTGHVRIMAAGVRYADRFPGSISCGECRSVRQTGVLPHGKRVHVGPREHGLALAVSEDADDAGAADPFDNFVTDFLEFRRRERGCFGFLKTQLRMRMEVLVNTLLPCGDCLQTG
jgi:hypothetical protein